MTGVITSLPPLIEQPPGNNSSNPAGLPGVTYTAAIPTLPQTWTALQTFEPGTIALAGTGGTSQVLKQTTVNGVVTVGQLSFADISGSIGPVQIPPPTPTTLGGVFSQIAASHQFVTQIGTDGSVSQAQPAFTDIAGSVAATQMPALTGDVTTPAGSVATTLATVNGNVGSFGSATQSTTFTVNAKGLMTAVTNVTVTPAVGSITGLGIGVATALAINVGTAGAPVTNGGALGTPSSGVGTNLTGTAASLTAGHVTTNANLTGDVTSIGNAATLAAGNAGNLNSGTLLAARMPALTGDITTSAGAVATSLTANAVTNAKMAAMNAFTFKGNNTSGSAAPTDVDISLLTAKASPTATDLVFISDQAASGAWKKVTVSALASAGSVASYNTRTGSVTATGTDVPLRSYIAGLTLSTAGSSTTFGVSAGVGTDSTNVSMMALASAYTKTTAAWAVGTGNGSFDGTGTSPTTGTGFYHVFLIQRPDTGVVDVLTSVSATAPTLPTNYTLFRRLGAMRTTGNNWISFTQIEETFYWATVVQDANTAVQGTTAILYPLSVPTGILVRPLFRLLSPSSQTSTMLVTSPSETDIAAPAGFSTLPGFDQVGGTSQTYVSGPVIYTDTSGNIRVRCSASAQSLVINTRGWVDSRGRFA